MKVLGIIDDVQKLATAIPTMRAYKLPGGVVPVKTWDLYEKTPHTWPDRPFVSISNTNVPVRNPSCLQKNGACLSQSVLESIIRDHLKQYNVAVELNQELIGIQQHQNYVVATIRDNENGNEYEITTEYLVGADGARGL
jgi:2-polyprenyl-6-methoxyphenol hydroxylase-like FAD-dependent oxidoreductase